MNVLALLRASPLIKPSGIFIAVCVILMLGIGLNTVEIVIGVLILLIITANGLIIVLDKRTIEVLLD